MMQTISLAKINIPHVCEALMTLLAIARRGI
jgi:hypothetical protein